MELWQAFCIVEELLMSEISWRWFWNFVDLRWGRCWILSGLGHYNFILCFNFFTIELSHEDPIHMWANGTSHTIVI
jgi:hypothetical protein